MDFINHKQILAIVCFLAGSYILKLCSEWERKRREELRDPKVRWAHYGRRKTDLLIPTTLRGTLMTLVGGGLAVYGFISFLLNV
jgi:hypothetical protein